MSATTTAPSSGSFVQRAIDVTFTLANGTFAESGTNTLTVSGLRVSADIVKMGGAGVNNSTIRIRGMTQSTMNELSNFGKLIDTSVRNYVSVYAGIKGQTLGLAFSGTASQAYTDYTGMPDVSFVITGLAGLSAAVQAISPSSYPGATDVVVILSSLAAKMGMVFQNNGVSGVMLASPYFSGSALNQARRAADAAGINLFIDDASGGKQTMAIWPRGGSRGGAVPLVSPETGMVGYPTFTHYGMIVRTLYNPSITYGAKIQVKSSLNPACGTWQVYGLTHNLESETPGGSWFTDLSVAAPGTAVVL